MATTGVGMGQNDYGACALTGVPATSAQILFPCQFPGSDIRNGQQFPIMPFYVSTSIGSQALQLNVAATAAFRLDYQFSADGGTTWQIGLQLSSSTVTVDGGAAGYTQSATMNIQVGYLYRVTLYNPGGTTLNAAYEWRLYSDNI